MPAKTPRLYDRVGMEEMRLKTPNKRLNRIEHCGYWCRIVLGDIGGVASRGHASILYDQLPVVQIAASTNAEEETVSNTSGKMTNIKSKL